MKFSEIQNSMAMAKSLGFSNVFTALKGAYKFLRTIEEPSTSDVRWGVQQLVKQATNNGVSPQVVLDAAPGLAQLYEERYDPPMDLDFLSALPKGTLGHEVARFLMDNKIDPLQNYLPNQNGPDNALAYAFHRSYKLHDILHVVFDCDTSIIGEIKIVSFSYAQGHQLAAALALGVLFMHLAIKHTDQLAEALRKSVEWYELGKTFPAHYTFRFEDHWESPVSDVKEMLRVA